MVQTVEPLNDECFPSPRVTLPITYNHMILSLIFSAIAHLASTSATYAP